jgi:hypothetical protein
MKAFFEPVSYLSAKPKSTRTGTAGESPVSIMLAGLGMRGQSEKRQNQTALLDIIVNNASFVQEINC